MHSPIVNKSPVSMVNRKERDNGLYSLKLRINLVIASSHWRSTLSISVVKATGSTALVQIGGGIRQDGREDEELHVSADDNSFNRKFDIFNSHQAILNGCQENATVQYLYTSLSGGIVNVSRAREGAPYPNKSTGIKKEKSGIT